MKINIADQYGSELIAILNLNGLSAKEGVDYLVWHDKIEKGKIIYTGGVDIENGIVIYNSRFPTRNLDNRKFAKVVINGELVGDFFIMGSFDKTDKRPSAPSTFPLDEAVWDKIIEAILNWGDPELVFKMTSKW